MDWEIRFSNQQVTPWSGLAFLRRMMDKMGFQKHLSSAEMLPEPGSNRGYSPYPYIIGSAVSGILEVLMFHPIDTIVKRLMSNSETILFKKGDDRSIVGKLSSSQQSFLKKI